jgi:hypothetical protein
MTTMTKKKKTTTTENSNPSTTSNNRSTRSLQKGKPGTRASSKAAIQAKKRSAVSKFKEWRVLRDDDDDEGDVQKFLSLDGNSVTSLCAAKHYIKKTPKILVIKHAADPGIKDYTNSNATITGILNMLLTTLDNRGPHLIVEGRKQRGAAAQSLNVQLQPIFNRLMNWKLPENVSEHPNIVFLSAKHQNLWSTFLHNMHKFGGVTIIAPNDFLDVVNNEQKVDWGSIIVTGVSFVLTLNFSTH